MSSDVGIVCGNCDWFNPRDGNTCSHCGNDLALFLEEDPLLRRSYAELEPSDAERASPPPPATLVEAEPDLADRVPTSRRKIAPRRAAALDEALVAAAQAQGVTVVRPVVIGPAGEKLPRGGAEELQMEQARHFICKSCYSPIPGGHKFCGKCGAPTQFADDYGATQYFGAMQVPNKAKLILIKGEGLDGISYHLNSTEHVAGRQQGAILFPDDAWLSPRHANFFYRDNRLFVRDEDSVNGVYVRVKEPVSIGAGQMFLCGEQVFRIEAADVFTEGAEPDGTYFYASPTKTWSFKIIQLLPGGVEGMVVHDEGGTVVIGREDCTMNFLGDRFMSLKHAQVEGSAGQFTLTDLKSQNGTFVRIDKERALSHGDYVFLGKQLLRVEVTP